MHDYYFSSNYLLFCFIYYIYICRSYYFFILSLYVKWEQNVLFCVTPPFFVISKVFVNKKILHYALCYQNITHFWSLKKYNTLICAIIKCILKYNVLFCLIMFLKYKFKKIVCLDLEVILWLTWIYESISIYNFNSYIILII